MKIHYEHTAIKAIFEAYKLPDNLNYLPVVLAWSSYESLCLYPEYSFLPVGVATYLQLPQSISEINNVIFKHKEQKISNRYIELQYPIYQLEQSLIFVENDLKSNDYIQARNRISHIKRFCNRYWSFLLDPYLCLLNDSTYIDSNDSLFACQKFFDVLQFLSWMSCKKIFYANDKNQCSVIQDGFVSLETIVLNASLFQSSLPQMLQNALQNIDGQQWWIILQEEIILARTEIEKWGGHLFSPVIYQQICEMVDVTNRVSNILNHWTKLHLTDEMIKSQISELHQGLIDIRNGFDAIQTGYEEMTGALLKLAKG